MFGTGEMLLMVVVLLALVFGGVHIAVALGGTAMLGIYLMTGDFQVVATFVGSTAYEAVRDYVFAVIPLFMLMGAIAVQGGLAKALFDFANAVLGRFRGGMAMAGVLACAAFGSISSGRSAKMKYEPAISSISVLARSFRLGIARSNCARVVSFSLAFSAGPSGT